MSDPQPPNPDVRWMVDLWMEAVRQHQLEKEAEAQGRNESFLLGNNPLQNEALEIYLAYEKNAKDLDHDLDAFMQAVRPIGSSSRLIHTAMELKRQISSALNACGDLCGEIWDRLSLNKNMSNLPRRMRNPGWSSHSSARMPKLFKELSSTLDTFLDRLDDIPEFSDKRFTDFLREFRNWLEYRADALAAHTDPEYQESTAHLRYMCQVMSDMSLYLKKSQRALTDFGKEGIAAIRDAQDRGQNRLQNMSTVATFFSAVTATTLQYSIDGDSFLGTLVRALWVSSLILSTASAINLQLAMHWRAAMYRSPRSALPVWASFCLDRAPIACLVTSVLTFSAGLVAWTFSSSLGILVSVTASALTGFTVVIVMTIVTWEARELLRDYTNARMAHYGEPVPGPLWIGWNKITYFPRRVWRKLSRATCNALSGIFTGWRTTTDTVEEELPNAFNINRPSWMRTQSSMPSPRRSVFSGNAMGFSLAESFKTRISRNHSRHPKPKRPPPPQPIQDEPTSQNIDPPLAIQVPGPVAEVVTSPLIQRFIRRGKELGRDPGLRASIRSVPMAPTAPRREQLARIRPTRMLNVDHHFKGDMHFSPDGSRLAISTIDAKVSIWDVTGLDSDETPVILPAPLGQFAWSQDSSLLVIILVKGFKVWNLKDLKEVSSYQTPDIPHSIGPIAWLQDRNAFATVFDRSLYIYDAVGKLEAKFSNLSRSALDICNIAIVGRSETPKRFGDLLLVGKVVPSFGDIREAESLWKKPKDAKAEHRLVVYNTDGNLGGLLKDPLEATFLNDAQHVAVSRDGLFALVSYADAFPELWTLPNTQNKTKLELSQRYIWSPVLSKNADQKSVTPSGVAGKARFGGEYDEWVIASNGVNEIYVWDRITGHLLQTLRADQILGIAGHHVDIAAVTCRVLNKGTAILMASASSSGKVVIWGCAQEQDGQATSTEPGTNPPSSLQSESDVTNRASTL